MDRVLVNNLILDQLVLSPAPWADSKAQLAYLDVAILTDTSQAGETDDLTYSINYSGIAKGLRKHFSGPSWQESSLSAHGLAEEAARYLLHDLKPSLSDSDSVQIKTYLPEALLHGGKLIARITRTRSDYLKDRHLRFDSHNARQDTLSIDDFQISTIIGLNDCERLQEQPVFVEVQTWPNIDGIVSDGVSMAWCARTLQEAVWKHVRTTNPLLLESLCPSLASAVISACSVPKVRARVDKPKAAMWTSTTAVEVTRHRNFFTNRARVTAPPVAAVQAKRIHNSGPSTSTNGASPSPPRKHQHTAYIALGSNLGDRAAYINSALSHLNNSSSLEASASSEALPSYPHFRVVKVVETSFLYESEPMYVLDQDRFLNGVCKVTTSLSPQDLLALVKSIEHRIGRRKTVDKGPREIDLDILLYDDDLVMRDDKVDLTVPHPLIGEREFVLRPLHDIAPTLVHPVFKQTISELFRSLPSGPSQLRQVVPLKSHPSTLDLSPSSRTKIMSILNVTPDSFSDGGSYDSTASAIAAAIDHIKQGADIVDIGGVSTRPGSSHVTEEEELSRIMSVVEGIRAQDAKVLLSIDTYRASVAEASIAAGANIINDISGGLHDPLMLETIARLDVPFILMHMRGRPEEVNEKRHQAYGGGNVVGGVRRELAQTVSKALAAGIKRWNIILDPGVGFSKDIEGNLALLRDLPAVTGRIPISSFSASSLLANDVGQDEDMALLRNFPVLVGISRKGFIGKITDRPDPKEREYGNAALHGLAIANGAGIIRVHDVRAARDAARITDAIYGKR